MRYCRVYLGNTQVSSRPLLKKHIMAIDAAQGYDIIIDMNPVQDQIAVLQKKLLQLQDYL